MPVFLERFFVPLCVAAVGFLVLNQFNLDRHQRGSLLIAVIALAYFASHTVFKAAQQRQAAATVATTSTTSQAPAAAAPPAKAAPVAPPGSPQSSTEPAATRERKEAPVTDRPKQLKSQQTVGNVTQHSTGPNSPNIATFGPNSPVTVHQGRAPWTLSSHQILAFADAIRPYRDLWDGKFDVVICVMGDPESTRMAESVVTAFRTAGWELPHGGYAQGMFAPVPVGVGMTVNGDTPTGRLLELLNVISNRLRRIGVLVAPMDVEVNKQGPIGHFMVRVGRRPDL